MSEPLNPYAPTLAGSDEPRETESDRADEPVVALSPLRAALRWTLVCSISAAPSFFFGLMLTENQIAGMVLGVLVFIVAYTLLDLHTARHRLRQKATVRRTLRIAYASRVLISVVFPLAFYVDLMCGLLSVTAMQWVFGEASVERPMGTLTAFSTTLVQGVCLNIVLAAYALLVHGLQLLILGLRRRFRDEAA